MKITWSPLSIEQVTELAQYIARDKPGAADKWVISIFDAVAKLSPFPESGRIVPEINKNEIREILFGNYRIIYQVSQSGIDILTVRHGKQILPRDEIFRAQG